VLVPVLVKLLLELLNESRALLLLLTNHLELLERLCIDELELLEVVLERVNRLGGLRQLRPCRVEVSDGLIHARVDRLALFHQRLNLTMNLGHIRLFVQDG
jgi:hypothetical protein